MTETKFSKYFNAHFNRSKRLEEKLWNLYTNVERFHWLHKVWIDEKAKIFDSSDWAKLPDSWKGSLNGFDRALFKLANLRKTTHCYLCNDGFFRSWSNVLPNLSCYSMPSDNDSTSLIPDTCVSVWVDAPNYVFGSINEKTMAILAKHNAKFVADSHTIKLNTVEQPV